MLYAAYGSNLHPLRLLARISSARFLKTAVVAGWRLRFNKRGTDGSAKANIERADAAVHVAVFEIDPKHREALDAIEGPGYRARGIEIPSMERCFTYTAHDLTGNHAPFVWYRDLVLSGARYHQFPEPYVRSIESVGAMPDPDVDRKNQHAELLHQLTKTKANA